MTKKIMMPEKIKDGTLLTIKYVASQKKPYLIINLSYSIKDNISKSIDWAKENKIRILNVAGPQESSCEGIYEASFDPVLRYANTGYCSYAIDLYKT